MGVVGAAVAKPAGDLGDLALEDVDQLERGADVSAPVSVSWTRRRAQGLPRFVRCPARLRRRAMAGSPSPSSASAAIVRMVCCRSGVEHVAAHDPAVLDLVGQQVAVWYRCPRRPRPHRCLDAWRTLAFSSWSWRPRSRPASWGPGRHFREYAPSTSRAQRPKRCFNMGRLRRPWIGLLAGLGRSRLRLRR